VERVFEMKVLRRIFGQKRDEVMRGLRKLHNEKLRDLYSSAGIIRIIKQRRMRWAGHVAQSYYGLVRCTPNKGFKSSNININ
jgi:hypothetical protein